MNRNNITAIPPDPFEEESTTKKGHLIRYRTSVNNEGGGVQKSTKKGDGSIPKSKSYGS